MFYTNMNVRLHPYFPTSPATLRQSIPAHSNNRVPNFSKTTELNSQLDIEAHTKMSSRSAIHQLRANRSRAGSSSQAHSILYGWSPEPETECEQDSSEGPPLSEFSRGLPRRNRAPSGRRPSASKSTAANGVGPGRRRPSLVEKLRVATGQRPSTSSYTAVNNEATRKRGPSLVAKAKELVNRPRTDTNAEPSFRRLPDQLSRYDESASENEKVRLSIEADVPCFCLIQRWKEATDWLKPSNYWKKSHPAMNYRLWRIIARNSCNDWKLQASAERNLEAATLLYAQKGGDTKEWWPEDLEEEILDSWSLSFGGHDPPRRKWTLED